MIVTFSVSNFRSFSSEETLSLVASNRLSGNHNNHTVPIPGSKESVLRTAVIYGANGAGKSNLFKALRYVQSIVLLPRNRDAGTGREAFRPGETANEPSTFDLQFIAAGKLYRFGFKVDDQRIIEEWLVHIDGGREKTLYERTTSDIGKVTIDAQGLKGAGKKLLALATVGGPQNQSFLATVYATLDISDTGEVLSGILNWFNGSLQLIGPGDPIGHRGHLLAEDRALLEFAGDFLRSASTGVDHLEIRKKRMSVDELRTALPRLAPKLLRAEDGVGQILLGDGNDLLVERKDGNHYYRVTIQAAHERQKGREVLLDLNEESDGTRRLLDLIPALHQIRSGSTVYFIDEIDRSLHPILVKEFLDFFLKSSESGNRQIIVTSHESNLLDLDLLRRDEIWFAEKDQRGGTRLYSLVDFKVRNDLEIRKHYLQGRFGAVPFLGDLDRLLEKTSQPG